MYGGGSVILITLLSNFGVSDFAYAANLPRRPYGEFANIYAYLDTQWPQGAVFKNKTGRMHFSLKKAPCPFIQNPSEIRPHPHHITPVEHRGIGHLAWPDQVIALVFVGEV